MQLSTAAVSYDLRTAMIFFFESLDVLKSKLSGYSNDSNEQICGVSGHCLILSHACVTIISF